MTRATQGAETARLLESSQLQAMLEALVSSGYDVIGPTVRDGAIVLDQIHSVKDLPAGWSDEQSPGHYRLKARDDQASFQNAVGPHSWKRYLHPQEVRMWSAERQNGTFRILNNHDGPARPFAFFGVRPCDLAAIHLQDRVLTGDIYKDRIYASRRRGVFLVVLQCTTSASTCFCSSLGTGPRPHHAFDLSLSELCGNGGPGFVIRAGSKRGARLLAQLNTRPASAEELQRENELLEAVSREQVRRLDTASIKTDLEKNFDNPGWDEVSARCLTCANCTMVCPTCFCTTIEDGSDLSGNHAERVRRWDSCFTLSFSYIHGGSVRASAKSRYRQWLTHKFASWVDQFGTVGCVGCGRCITWCPVGIDLTQSIRTLQEGANHGNS